MFYDYMQSSITVVILCVYDIRVIIENVLYYFFMRFVIRIRNCCMQTGSFCARLYLSIFCKQ